MSLMQIPRKIEYALRAMIYLADRPAGVARGSEIAQPLLLITNTTGNRQRPAMFRVSATSPCGVEVPCALM